MNRKPSLLAQPARERRANIEPEPLVLSEEEQLAIKEGYLKVFAIKGGPIIWIDLRAAKEKP